MYKLRVTFKKSKKAKYISHLDLLRAFVRAIRRAKVPVKYSEGFNPHAQLTFALPLAVGVTSDCEVVDITLRETVDLPDTVKRLKRAMPGGIEITEAFTTLDNMPDYSRAAYTVTVENGQETGAIKDVIMSAMRRGDIIVEKKTKKKTTEVNIIDHIYDFEIVQAEGALITFNMTLSAGSEFTLKPDLVLTGISSVVPQFEPVDVEIHRRAIE